MNAEKIIIINNSNTIQDTLTSGNYQWSLEDGCTVTMVHFIESDNCDTRVVFTLGPSSILYYHPIVIGGSPSSLTISARLHNGAELKVIGAYALKNQENCAIITHQEHEQAESKSVLIINGIVADDARVSYHGAITIQKNASKSDAIQENKTLLIGARARAISIPSLEVKNNDVQCAHGSAIGPLQEEQLRYAQSRGISFDNARRLLITSFFWQTLEGMYDKNLQETIVGRLVNKILGAKE